MRQFLPVIFICLLGCAPSVYNIPPVSEKSEVYPFVEKGWRALATGNSQKAGIYADKCQTMYSEKAKLLNERCFELNTGASHKDCALLNDVAQCIVISAEVYAQNIDDDGLRAMCDELKNFYFNSFILDEKERPWRPTEYCQERMKDRGLTN